MYPVLVGVEIHEEGVAKVYGGVLGEEEEMVHHDVGVTGDHYLILTVIVGFRHDCDLSFVSFHILAFSISSLEYSGIIVPLQVPKSMPR